ncbi:MAG: DUF4838 domain-containing protein [Kiritimatiellia bacterium]
MNCQAKRGLLKLIACLLGMVCMAGALGAEPAEYEINLVRNAAFQPGMDGEAPQFWSYKAPDYTNIHDIGRCGRVTFADDCIVIEGPSSLNQYGGDTHDDITPSYKFECEMKTIGGRGAHVSMVVPNQRSTILANSKSDVWEHLSQNVDAGDHYGFYVKIDVPAGVKLAIRSLRVTARLDTEADSAIAIADQGGTAPAKGILLPSMPNWAEQLAAHELRVSLHLISGVALPVFVGGAKTVQKGYISLRSMKKPIKDPSALHASSKTTAPADDPDANGFRLTCGAGRVELIGGNDAGVLAGALYLASRLGCVYYAPGVHGITTNHALTIPEMTVMRQPAFEFTSGPSANRITMHGWKYGYIYSHANLAPCNWAAPNTAGWVHPVCFLAPPHLYAANHPEYYALRQGKRVVNFPTKRLNRSKGYLHLCLGNPDLHEVVAERIGRLMDMFPQCKYFSIAQGDGREWCECELCAALDADPDIWTDRLIAYANAVAKILEDKHPDKKLIILAYSEKREELPVREKLHRNVAICYALYTPSWRVWQDTYCEQNQRGLKLLEDWNAFTGANLTLFMYPVNTYENAEKLKLAVAKGVRGFHQCGLRGDFPEVTLYTTGRLIWEPDADIEELIDEIMPHLYGPAAPQMREYFNMHHAFIKECVDNRDMWRRYTQTHMLRRVPTDFANRALSVVTEAEKALAEGHEKALARVRYKKYKLLYSCINDLRASYPTGIPENLYDDYADKISEMIRCAYEHKEKYTPYPLKPLSDWLKEATEYALNLGEIEWYKNKKLVDDFLADPQARLREHVYFQTPIEGGWELPAKAWIGGNFYQNYKGSPAAIIRRPGSHISVIKTYFKLDTVPDTDISMTLAGLDNEKEHKAIINIRVNDRDVYTGPVDFPKNKWGRHVYTVPVGYFKPGDNVILISNVTPTIPVQIIDREEGQIEETMAADYNWGWCMVGALRLTINESR